jgi:hypothetical protein
MSRRDTRGSSHDPLDLALDDPPPSQSGSPGPSRSTAPHAGPPHAGPPHAGTPHARTPQPRAREFDPSATLPHEFDEEGDALDPSDAPFDLTPPPPKQATPPPQSRQTKPEPSRPEPGSRSGGKSAPKRERRPVDDMPEVPPASALRRPAEVKTGRSLLGIALVGVLVLGCTGSLGALLLGGFLYTRPVPVPEPVVAAPVAPPEPPPPTDIDGIPIERKLRVDPNGAPPPPGRPEAP